MIETYQLDSDPCPSSSHARYVVSVALSLVLKVGSDVDASDNLLYDAFMHGLKLNRFMAMSLCFPRSFVFVDLNTVSEQCTFVLCAKLLEEGNRLERSITTDKL